jgi:hypothetical protein
MDACNWHCCRNYGTFKIAFNFCNFKETAETITRQKDIKLIPNQISTSGSLKAQIKRKMASICKKYEDIVVNMVQKVKGRKQRREE